MKRRVAILIGAAAVLTAMAAGAQPVLTGAIAFETDSSGAATDGYWNTAGGDGIWNLYVIPGAPGGAFVNSGNGGATSISIPLSPGTYTFTLQGDHSLIQTYRGVNLFFDGDNTNPGISVYEANGVTGGQPDGNSTRELNGSLITGANSLTWEIAGARVVLSDYLVRTSVSNEDRVLNFNNTPNQINDDLITFTLTVELWPVPALGSAGAAALALLLAAAGAVGLRRLG